MSSLDLKPHHMSRRGFSVQSKDISVDGCYTTTHVSLPLSVVVGSLSKRMRDIVGKKLISGIRLCNEFPFETCECEELRHFAFDFHPRSVVHFATALVANCTNVTVMQCFSSRTVGFSCLPSSGRHSGPTVPLTCDYCHFWKNSGSGCQRVIFFTARNDRIISPLSICTQYDIWRGLLH
jgi:hypothetical protein